MFGIASRVALLFATAVTAASSTTLVGCRGCDRPGNAGLLGVTGSVASIDLSPYVEVAHAVVSHAPAAENLTGPSPTLPGRRVFVTAWSPGHEPVSATGLGASLFDSVLEASREVAKTASSDARVELNVVTAVTPSAVGPEMHERVYDLGLHGYVGVDGQGAVGWLLPSELVDRHWVTTRVVKVPKGDKPSEMRILDGEAMAAVVAARAHIDPAQVASMTMYRFDAADRLEGKTPGSAPIVLYRTMPLHPKTVTPESLLHAVHAGADYLTRVTDESGKFEYWYDPYTDKVPHGYGMVRHAGTIYALMCAYEEEHDATWLAAAKRAIVRLKASFKEGDGGSYILDAKDEEQQKVGGGGLAIVALAQYATATGDKADLDSMRSLAGFILKQQYPDGHFRANADVAHEDESHAKVKKETWYYPGEAILGLVRLYALDPDPKWLAAARSAADYLINVRDVHKGIKDQIPDHWLSYALHDLYVRTGDEAYAKHAHKIALEIVGSERTNAALPFEDYPGSFIEEGESTPTSTRLEALTSTFQLSRFMGEPIKAGLPVAMQIASFTTSQQLDADSAYFARAPDKAIGGVREDLHDNNVRIDFVQHAVCSWLRLARILRDPTYGAPPPPETPSRP